MATTVEAIYTGGVLRPTQPLEIAEGTRVEVLVLTPRPAAESRTPAEILAAIAALPEEPGAEGFSGKDHDEVLYGRNGAR